MIYTLFPSFFFRQKQSQSICLLFGRIRAGDDWRKVDGVVAGVAGDHQHQLPGRARLLLLRPTHHQEEPRHQADQNIHFHHAKPKLNPCEIRDIN